MPSSPGAIEHRVADLQLRGVARPLRARVTWPVSPSRPPALLVFFPGGDGAGDGAERLSSLAEVVVLSLVSRLAADDVADATTTLEWAADHAAELAADPGRLLVAGEGAGGALAARVALHARDRGWPALARQVLIEPDLGGLPAAFLAGVAPATVVTTAAADDGRRYAAGLRDAGVEVEEIHHEGGPRERMLAFLARSLRRPLFDDEPPAAQRGPGPPIMAP